MIITAIIGILLEGIVPFFVKLHPVYQRSRASSEIARSSLLIMPLLTENIRAASAVFPRWKGFKTSGNTLILKVASDYIVYHRDSRDPRILIKRVFAGTSGRSTRQILCKNLTNIKFTVANSWVAYEAKFDSGPARSRLQRNFVGAAALRNPL